MPNDHDVTVTSNAELRDASHRLKDQRRAVKESTRRLDYSTAKMERRGAKIATEKVARKELHFSLSCG
jgi:hypothetical protein